MEEYNDYRITIKPNGPIGTPWRSDTMFGHLVWFVAMQEGNKAVKSLVETFLDGDPPFILSDGFPEDCMPSPLFDSDDIASVVQSLEDYARYKKNKNSRFITAYSFHRIRKENVIDSGFINEPYTTVETIHASSNRNTNSTGDEGQLFSTHDTFASWLVMSGVDLYTVQRLLGHTNIRTSMRYAHLAPNFLEQEIGNIDNILSSEINTSDASSVSNKSVAV